MGLRPKPRVRFAAACRSGGRRLRKLMRAEAPLHPIARLPEEWRASLAARGERTFSAKQVFDWIHRRGVVDAAAMTNLSARLRAALAEEGLSPGVCVPEQVHRS